MKVVCCPNGTWSDQLDHCSAILSIKHHKKKSPLSERLFLLGETYRIQLIKTSHSALDPIQHLARCYVIQVNRTSHLNQLIRHPVNHVFHA